MNEELKKIREAKDKAIEEIQSLCDRLEKDYLDRSVDDIDWSKTKFKTFDQFKIQYLYYDNDVHMQELAAFRFMQILRDHCNSKFHAREDLIFYLVFWYNGFLLSSNDAENKYSCIRFNSEDSGELAGDIIESNDEYIELAKIYLGEK